MVKYNNATAIRNEREIAEFVDAIRKLPPIRGQVKNPQFSLGSLSVFYDGQPQEIKKYFSYYPPMNEFAFKTKIQGQLITLEPSHLGYNKNRRERQILEAFYMVLNERI
ncbi:MAG: hypothetical protein HY364_00075 [Candidatus Aenigmarchaeota archaeon]|nr:hypothetical protein [Candidatus Aenigmarchaeota archaeon]